MTKWSIKPAQEILDKCHDMIRRHRRRFLQKNLRPCPWNCYKAEVSSGHQVVGCTECKSKNPDFCKKPSLFKPFYTKEELVQQFREKLKDPHILLREYRDLVVFFWCFHLFDMQTLDKEAIEKIESGVENMETRQIDE